MKVIASKAEQDNPRPRLANSAAMAKKKKNKRRAKPRAIVIDYIDPEGNILTLRQSLSNATIAKIGEPPSGDAASLEDAWRRRTEAMFERLVVSWEIAGLPLNDQKMLLGRYRMADAETQSWVRQTIADHVNRHIPGLSS
jgi:hypothetical protein